MNFAAVGLTALVALLHLYFLVLEMFLWESPAGRRAFGLSAEMAQATRTLAANQGLYNGFLAAGLVWALMRGADGLDIRYFFLGCVVVAGIFGAVTANPRILWIQALPATLAIVATWLARG
ncbi:MAG: DUF1304 domain-containing protein [Thermoanaerobaculia bacterium]